MEGELYIQLGISIPDSEFEIATSRSSGPGGQHVQKTNSRVTLRWNISQTSALTDEERARVLKVLAAKLTTEGELIVHVDSERSQFRNKQIARERLAEIVRHALKKPKARKKTKPSKASKQRRIAAKKHRGDLKGLRQKLPIDI